MRRDIVERIEVESIELRIALLLAVEITQRVASTAPDRLYPCFEYPKHLGPVPNRIGSFVAAYV